MGRGSSERSLSKWQAKAYLEGEGDPMMVALKKSSSPVRSEVIRDPSVMSGDPVVRGTRVPAMTIVAYLRAGRTSREIFEDYPTLPVDGIDAVVAWADEELGPGWRAPVPAGHARP
jgi:uncharacterized protein (DUF433 family)